MCKQEIKQTVRRVNKPSNCLWTTGYAGTIAFSAMTLLGGKKHIWAVKKLSTGIIVVVLWLELSASDFCISCGLWQYDFRSNLYAVTVLMHLSCMKYEALSDSTRLWLCDNVMVKEQNEELGDMNRIVLF